MIAGYIWMTVELWLAPDNEEVMVFWPGSVSMHTDLLLASLLPLSSHQPCSSITLEAGHHMGHQFSYNHLIVMHQIPSSISSVILHCHEGLNVRNKVYNFCRWWVAAIWLSLPVKEDLLIVPSDVTRVKGCIEQQLLLWEPRFRGATHRLCEKNKRVIFRINILYFRYLSNVRMSAWQVLYTFMLA